ncbi:MAG: dihydrofolate reductase family protein, partial [Methanomicrobiales archaeon]
KSEECRTGRLNRGVDEHPVRIVVDSTARIQSEAAVLHKGAGKRIVAVSRRADPKKIAALQSYATVIIAGEDEVDLAFLMDKLGEMGIRRVMVEGGGTLIAGLITAGLVNEIYTFIGNMIIGGKDSPTFVDGEGFILESGFCRLNLLEMDRIESGVLLHWNVHKP